MTIPVTPITSTGKGSSMIVGMAIGAVVGMVSVGLIGGVLAYGFVKKKEADVRRGWNLVPVVVAAVDIKEKTVVSFDMISQRSVPEQFVTSSVVKPDSASYIVNQKINVPVQAGDPLLWSNFEVSKASLVLCAARDVPTGADLQAADIEERSIPEEVLTLSYVRMVDRPQVLGKVVAAPFRKGDPILWTHFDAMPPPIQKRGK